MTTNNRRKRLGLQISVVVGLLVFASVATAGLLISRTSSEQLTDSKGAAMAELAYQLSDKLDRGMYERLRDMQVLASLQTMRDPAASQSEKRALLDSLKKSFPDYAFIGLTDSQGKIIASADGLLQGASVAARPWFIQTKAGQKLTVNDVHEALLLAKLLPNPSREPLRFVDFSAPVYDPANNFVGVLGSHLSFSWAESVRKSVLEAAEVRDGVEVFIVAADNKVLLGPDNYEAESFDMTGLETEQFSGHYAVVGQESEKYLVGLARSTGYQNYPGFGWKVVARQPASLALQSVTDNRTRSLVIAGLVGLLFTAVSAWYVRRSLKQEEALEQAKDEFVSIASHQLRTPLAAMRWYSELALEDKHKLSPDQQTALENIATASTNMISLVNTMLNASRVELGRLTIQPKPTDIAKLVKRNLQEVHPLALERRVTLEAELQPDMPEVEVDPLLMDQVVHNLLTNAIRYSRDTDALVTVSAGIEDGHLMLRVKDNGIGIPAEAQQRLFERFYRADNAKKVVENGSGLGLHLVKMIVNQGGGEIAVDSTEGVGTTFTVSFPSSGMKSKKGDRLLSR